MIIRRLEEGTKKLEEQQADAHKKDFLPVGDGEKSGDAIAIRWGNGFAKEDDPS
jgi:hypothetical protein